MVLLAERPYLDFYRRAVAHIGEAYFRVGSSAFERAEEQLASWLARGVAGPALPLPGGCSSAGVGSPLQRVCAAAAEALGSHELAAAAHTAEAKGLDEASLGAASACVGPDACVQLLGLGLAPSCWRLWQLLITGETLMVFNLNPNPTPNPNPNPTPNP